MVLSNSETEPMLPNGDDESRASQTSEKRDCLSRLRRWFLVEPILVIYLFGIFPVQTISQKYILEWFTKETLDRLASQNLSSHDTNATFDPCHSNKSDPDYQFQEYIQSQSSQFALYESMINGVPAVFVTLILGAGSDLFGRRFAILPPLIGNLIANSISTFVICTKSSIYWFFLRDVIFGFSGSFFSILMGCLAYVADRTPPEKRMIRITLIEMTMLVSGVICPIVLGKVTTEFGNLVPLLFIVATSAVNLLYAFIFMPNGGHRRREPSAAECTSACSSPTDKSTTFLSIVSLLWIQVRSMLALFIDKSASAVSAIRWRRLKLNLLIAAFFITNLPTFDPSVSTLFMMNSPLCWDVDAIGLFSGVACGVASVGAIIVTPLFKRVGMPDYVIALLAGLASTITSVYKAFVQTKLMMFLTLSLSMIGILFVPSLRSLMSGLVNNDQQGAIFGAIACVEVICGAVGTTIFNSVYSATLHISTGFVFFVMAVFYFTGGVLVCAHVVLVRLDARKGSALSVPIDEPLLDEPLLDEPLLDEPLLNEGESDRSDGLDDDGLIN